MSDREALKIFARQPVSQEMINFLVSTTNSTIQVKQNKLEYSISQVSPSTKMLVSPVKKSVSLSNFIKKLIKYSNVQTPTLMATLIYLNKLRNILPANAVGIETTRHRIFLAALILAAKSLNDSSPLNRHWTKYTDGLLSIEEVNMAERELIGLLKWNISIKEDELIIALQPFLTSIKLSLAKKLEVESTQKISYYRLSNSSSSQSSLSHRSASSPISITSPLSYKSSLSAPSPINSNSSSPSSPLSFDNSPNASSRSSSNMSLSSYHSNLSMNQSNSSYSLRSSNSNYTLKSGSSSNYNMSTIEDEQIPLSGYRRIPAKLTTPNTYKSAIPKTIVTAATPIRSSLRQMKSSISSNSLSSSTSSSSLCSAVSVHNATTAERPHPHTLNLVNASRIAV